MKYSQSVLITFAFCFNLIVGYYPSVSFLSNRAYALTPLTTITTCDSGTFASDVEAGGTVQFGINCTDLVLSSVINIGSGLQVSIEGNGFTVVLDAGGKTQLFVVTGGHLNITGITIERGSVTGTAGSSGTAGTVGKNGVDGTNGASAGASGTAGQMGKMMGTQLHLHLSPDKAILLDCLFPRHIPNRYLYSFFTFSLYALTGYHVIIFFCRHSEIGIGLSSTLSH